MKTALLLAGFCAMLLTPLAATAEDCPGFAEALAACQPYHCFTADPMAKGASAKLEKKIIGKSAGKCLYAEQKADGGKLECMLGQETTKDGKPGKQMSVSEAVKDGHCKMTAAPPAPPAPKAESKPAGKREATEELKQEAAKDPIKDPAAVKGDAKSGGLWDKMFGSKKPE